MKPQKLKLIEESTATTYTFRREDGKSGDWARCTINDRTGELSIQSDWGNWSHSWYIPHTGCDTLTAFIARGSYDYLANKLMGSATRKFDAEATINAFRTILCQRRREDGSLSGDRALPNRLDKTSARELWDALGDLLNDGGIDSADLFLRNWYDSIERDRFGKFITDEPYHHLESSYTGSYQVMMESILPALVGVCRDKMKGNQHTGSSGGWCPGCDPEGNQPNRGCTR